MKTIAVISDTHGLLRAQALEALRGSDLVVHAGDIGSPEVIAALQDIGPVFAVRGNTDRAAWTTAYPKTKVVDVESVLLFVLHDVSELACNPLAEGFQVVIHGHSHRPSVIWEHGTLYLNPGSAGPRRFRLPVTVAKLLIQDGKATAEIIDLPV